jgi:hypothetical protein
LNAFPQQLRLARRLLLGAAMSFCALTAGCLWPTSLHDEASFENVAPAFSALTMPPFGPLVRTGAPIIDSLTVFAVDPNPDQLPNNGPKVLHARLFELGTEGPQSRFYTHIFTDLLYPQQGTIDPASTPLSGSLFGSSGTNLCMEYPNGGDLFVVVADRAFSDMTGQENTAPGGLTAENHWELSCP